MIWFFMTLTPTALAFPANFLLPDLLLSAESFETDECPIDPLGVKFCFGSLKEPFTAAACYFSSVTMITFGFGSRAPAVLRDSRDDPTPLLLLPVVDMRLFGECFDPPRFFYAIKNRRSCSRRITSYSFLYFLDL
jgi:hypothetical protein